MLLLKACPKCSGDMRYESEELHCFQCGFIRYSTPPLPYVLARSLDVVVGLLSAGQEE